MFGVKTRMKQYLNQIKPWAIGKDNRGWLASDFDDLEVKAARMDPTAVIFTLPLMPLSAFDRLFLSADQYAAALNFYHAASNFNQLVVASNNKRVNEVRYSFIKMVHASGIGTRGTGGLFDAFNNLSIALDK